MVVVRHRNRRLRLIFALLCLFISLASCANKCTATGKAPGQGADLSFCQQYRASTCCNATHTRDIKRKAYPFFENDEVEFSHGCRQWSVNMLCSECDPAVGVGSVKGICLSACDRWYDLCKTQLFTIHNQVLTACSASSMVCYALNTVVSSGREFCEKSGFQVPSPKELDPLEAALSQAAGRTDRPCFGSQASTFSMPSGSPSRRRSSSMKKSSSTGTDAYAEIHKRALRWERKIQRYLRKIHKFATSSPQATFAFLVGSLIVAAMLRVLVTSLCRGMARGLSLVVDKPTVIHDVGRRYDLQRPPPTIYNPDTESEVEPILRRRREQFDDDDEGLID